jgi:hypothetical protein
MHWLPALYYSTIHTYPFLAWSVVQFNLENKQHIKCHQLGGSQNFLAKEQTLVPDKPLLNCVFLQQNSNIITIQTSIEEPCWNLLSETIISHYKCFAIELGSALEISIQQICKDDAPVKSSYSIIVVNDNINVISLQVMPRSH